MNTIELCNFVDDIFLSDGFNFEITKVELVTSITLVDGDDNEIINFSRINQSFAYEIDERINHIDRMELENILSPYIGKRLFVSLFY